MRDCLTRDMITYRKNYYRDNRDYLLSYSKWYYKYLKYEEGLITYDELEDKPKKKKYIKKRKTKKELDYIYEKEKKKKEFMTKKTGSFLVVFD